MKPEPKVKKLMLRKETLRDLTADHAGNVRGGGKGGNGNTKKCGGGGSLCSRCETGTCSMLTVCWTCTLYY
jgi:hypothetical protein